MMEYPEGELPVGPADQHRQLHVAATGSTALAMENKALRQQLADAVKRAESAEAVMENMGFRPMTIAGRRELKLPIGHWLVLQDGERLGLTRESHSSDVVWVDAAARKQEGGA